MSSEPRTNLVSETYMTSIVSTEKCSELMHIFSELMPNISKRINIFSEPKHNIF